MRAHEVPIKTAVTKFVDDVERRCKSETHRKYKYVMSDFEERYKDKTVPAITVQDLRDYAKSWTLSPSSARKRIELLRGFFSFCVESKWRDDNPAKSVKPPLGHASPTAPFSDEEWEKINWALDQYAELHPQTLPRTQKQIRALVVLLRHSGLRISDAVSLKRERIDKDGRLFIRAIKNQKPVFLPLPPKVIQAIDEAEEGNSYIFWSGLGNLKTAVTDWQGRLQKLCADGGIKGRGFAHRCRANFSVDLLNEGVPVEMVATILGNSPRIVERHYSMFVKSRQISLEAAVKATWS